MEDEELIVEVRPEGDRVVLCAAGALDSFTAPRLRDAVDRAVREGRPEVLVDLRRLEFMDSGGVHVLLDLHEGRWPTRFALLHDDGPAMLPLRLAGLEAILPSPCGVR